MFGIKRYILHDFIYKLRDQTFKSRVLVAWGWEVREKRVVFQGIQRFSSAGRKVSYRCFA